MPMKVVVLRAGATAEAKTTSRRTMTALVNILEINLKAV